MMDVMGELQGRVWPSGLVTVVLADLEGSASLWESDPAAMRKVMATVDDLVASAAADHGGHRPLEQGEGDSFVVVFARAGDALVCARALRGDFGGRDWPSGLEVRFRMGLHVGEVEATKDGVYSGAMLARGARVRDLGSGGQVLVTAALRELVADVLPEGVSLHDHGEHRLRGLTRPERVFELCDDARPEPQALRARSEEIHNLPTELTELIGRESGVAEVVELISTHRLVSLVGAGGSGKTRLAIRAGHESVLDHRDGVWWVDLSAMRHGHLVAGEIAASAGAGRESTDRPLDALVRDLAEREVLLIIDNCEHLLPACAEVADALLHGCPGVRILTTSREPLGVDGEMVVRVPSLSVPDAGATVDQISEAASVQMLAACARRVRPGFVVEESNAEVVAGICRQLDGLPLAIELAAARLRVLSPDQILDLLDERFRMLTGGARTALPRQRTLEASVQWSVDLLDDQERRVLQRLAVFAGSFDLPAAEAVCADDVVDTWAVLDLLTRLADRSLVQADHGAGGTRYHLLETIRAYVRQAVLSDDDVDELRDRHLEHYRRAMHARRSALWRDRSPAAFDDFNDDLPDVRAALDWASGRGDVAASLDIVESGLAYWLVRSLSQEMLNRLDRLAERADLDDAQRAKLLTHASTFAFMALDNRRAEDMGRHAVELTAAGEDPLARCQALLGWVHAGNVTLSVDGEELMAAAREAVELADGIGRSELRARAAGVFRAVAGALSDAAEFERVDPDAIAAGQPPQVRFPWLAVTAHRLMRAGRLGEAAEKAREAIAIAGGVVTALESVHHSLGYVELQRGNLDQAESHLATAKRLFATSSNRSATIASFPQAIEIAYRRGDLDRGRREAADTLDATRPHGNGIATVEALLGLGWLELHAGDLATAADCFEECRAINRVPARTFLGWTDLGDAHVAARRGEVEVAWQLAHAALESFDTTRHMGNPIGVAVTFELLAGLAAERELAEFGARVLGAADRIMHTVGYARMPHEVTQQCRAVDAISQRLDDGEYGKAFVEGSSLSLADAIAIVRRGRGTKSRPAAGWDSLTPAELDVAALVAAGHTNREIADKLFVTVNTTKTHLTHIYAKLGIRSRAALAREASQRSPR